MGWRFALVNNRLAEIFFKGEKRPRVFTHCYVERSEYKSKQEQGWIDKDTAKCRFSCQKGKYKRLKNS